ncbi:MAG: winged helix-turn-helix transcriptional regulator [Candidatus Omnitrophica bacterium]|nr:winged helix-turn-helix transcriptional regulator [Candidatus Omnitrophota bacterium]MCA9426648.1 winged helix-turn-helix transcriptional regulator [Candidatus Omnitrophota bacterium]MCA9431688.1 winged helix-turn-helix transcriptional regulator [Candidatus Omnitrophota bacterium]MCA9438255.1 winged helix-turn-helix transcriptional regulator [Candidatus Omnitrophota bacterium]MCA9447662.1 winged helix-turn-helix transcriptional regulator [Candidatus Omnitrophota bacterium]
MPLSKAPAKRVNRRTQRTSESRRTPSVPLAPESIAGRWTFLTNHAHVLILLSRNPSLVLREVAVEVGITERAVQRIIADLEEAGVLQREKVGRQNRYRILPDKPLRHPIEAHRKVDDLLNLINSPRTVKG